MKGDIKRYEYQRLWQPLYCAEHGGVFVAHIEDVVEGVEDDLKDTYEEVTFRKFICACEGCNRLLKKIAI
jgi:hypothetical protein